MSVDKLRRALLLQKQRIDGAQLQQGKQANTAPATAVLQTNPSSRTKRKAQTQEVERGDDAKTRLAGGAKASNKVAPASVDTPSARQQQAPSAAHKKHKFAASLPQKPSSALSSLSSKLASSRFRWLNEQLYTLPSSDAFAHFSAHPGDYAAYHIGFRQQVQRWPSHPLDAILAHLQSLSTPHVIADMGCGDARIAATLAGSAHTVHSFDLVPASPLVTACNMRRTPLAAQSVDTLVYCLSLMPTDYHALLGEAMRILKPGGELIVAEVSSRLVEGGGVEGFVRGLEAMGVTRRKVVDNDYFALVWCTRDSGTSKKASGSVKKAVTSGGDGRKGGHSGKVVLTPCIYKKR